MSDLANSASSQNKQQEHAKTCCPLHAKGQFPSQYLYYVSLIKGRISKTKMEK